MLPLLRILGVLALPSASLAQEVMLSGKDQLLTGNAQIEFSIGAVDGEDWEVFTRITAAGFDGSGNLYVLDGGSSRVLKYDASGSFVSRIGRPGRGPAELARPVALDVRGDGSLGVLDAANGYVRFGPDGEHEATVRPTEPVYSRSVVASGDALILAQGALRATGRDAGGGVPILRLALSDGETASVIFEAPVPTTTASSAPTADGTAAFTFTRPPVFSPTVRLAPASGNGFAIAYDGDWLVEIRDGDGRLRRALRRPFEARPTRQADREAVLARRAAASGGGAGTFGDRPARIRTTDPGQPAFAETIPVIRGMVGDGRGLLWVARETTPVGASLSPIDVIGPDGRYVGTLHNQALPLAFSVDGRAVYVERDELDVQRVVVRRLPTGWLGS